MNYSGYDGVYLENDLTFEGVTHNNSEMEGHFTGERHAVEDRQN